LAVQFFSKEQMERLRSYPDIGREELIRSLSFLDGAEAALARLPPLEEPLAGYPLLAATSAEAERRCYLRRWSTEVSQTG
jgi:hypothetical protein